MRGDGRRQRRNGRLRFALKVAGEILLTAGVVTGLFLVWFVGINDVVQAQQQAGSAAQVAEEWSESPVGESDIEPPTEEPVTLALSMVVIGAGPAVSQSQEKILAALRRLLETQALQRIQIESESSIAALKFADRLHSGIRGSFHARMMRLQKQIDEGALTDAENEIDALVEALREEQPPLDSPATLHDLLDFLSHWDGIVTIAHSIEKEAIPESLVGALTTVVMNAVNDAIRHGEAQTIDISFHQVDGVAELVVTNDGIKSYPLGAAGLGHATLDRFAQGAWERVVTPQGLTELRVRFSVDHAE